MIEIDRLSKSFATTTGATHQALADISLTVSAGEFVSILGPSGCGKSTLLYIVGGFVPGTGGQVRVNGKPVSGPGPDRGPVFQEFALFPWKTVHGNVMYGLLEQGMPREEAEARVAQLLELVHLKGFEGFYPKELSGGMKQRVAIARTLAYGPQTLLMDEARQSAGRRAEAAREAREVDLDAAVRAAVLERIAVVHADVAIPGVAIAEAHERVDEAADRRLVVVELVRVPRAEGHWRRQAEAVVHCAGEQWRERRGGGGRGAGNSHCGVGGLLA